MEECPVCGTELYVDRETEFVARHLGRQYRFCSADHRTQFEEAPGGYV
ncbi:TRASH domain-containing protein [Haladaptatus sp. R4]|nr:TRASH domain-containing protein [Haladaptatus sp. R4]KZN24420.1 TRASH domain-containing protein [Haladaptatus sp. R4]